MRRRELRQTRQRLNSRRFWLRQRYFWGGALLLGLAAALFARLADQAESLFRDWASATPWLPLLITPLGLVAISLLTRRYFPYAEGSGIPQTIAALESQSEPLRARLLTFRIAFGKVLMALLGLLCGASMGRQGPMVHIGASILYSISRHVRFNRHDMGRGLILAGGAAGVAAAFNTPLAGIVFAIEELNRSFEQRNSATILTAVVIAGVTAMVLLGDYNYIGKNSATVPITANGIALILLCGTLGGVLGGLFSTLLLRGSTAITPLLLQRPIVIPALCGLTLAAIGLLSSGSSYGTGHHEVMALLYGEMEGGWLYPVAKMGATLASFFSGIPGGIFAPSLAAGAGVGAAIAQWFSPELLTAAIMLGMVGYFSAVVQTPITAFVIVLEMTDNPHMLLPMIATALIAFGISRRLCPVPIYRALADNFLESGKS
jgi:H+/Cl- antiporter ClcA